MAGRIVQLFVHIGDSVTRDAEKEKVAVAALLKQQLGLELSETKTLVTPVTKAFAGEALPTPRTCSGAKGRGFDSPSARRRNAWSGRQLAARWFA